ncbi:MAG: vitamin K epoxide reductase family protein [Gemmatimonadota bacterium]
MSDIRRGQATVAVALMGVFLSLYLVLYRLGVYGELVCGSGSCEVVQASTFSVFLGIPVAAWGLAWYVAVFVTALVQSRRLDAEGPDAKWPGLMLAVLAAGGLAFSAYLTWIEVGVLHAICRWCVGSAILTVLIFLGAAPWRALRRSGTAAPAA